MERILREKEIEEKRKKIEIGDDKSLINEEYDIFDNSKYDVNLELPSARTPEIFDPKNIEHINQHF